VSISTDAPADGRRSHPQRRLHAPRSAAEDEEEESKQVGKRGIIEPRFSPDQRRQIKDLPAAEVLAKDTGYFTDLTECLA